MPTSPLLLAILLAVSPAETISLSDAQALSVGKRIWKNECGGTVDGLTSWNKGEGFASMGIGHFIWYPAGKDFPYEESFPPYLRFAADAGATLPSWLRSDPSQPCPWDSREAFMKDFQSERMTELRRFLRDTVALQARFAAQRLARALPKILENAPAAARGDLEARFKAVAATPGGVYALMDYVNFKGEGTNPKERYQGEGWGLLQVLELMPPSTSGESALAAFREGARAALRRRVAHAPPDRQAQEEKWLKGWLNRIETYRN